MLRLSARRLLLQVLVERVALRRVVRQQRVRLDVERELRRRALDPQHRVLLARREVVGGVDLDQRELRRVEPQPRLGALGVGRVEVPVLDQRRVGPRGGADQDPSGHLRCTAPTPSPRPRGGPGRSSPARRRRAGAGARRSARPSRAWVGRLTRRPASRGKRAEPIVGRVRVAATTSPEIASSAPTVNADPEARADPVAEARIRVPVVPVEERPGEDGEQGVDEDDIHESAPAKLRHERRPRWPERRGAGLHEHHHHEQRADPDERP